MANPQSTVDLQNGSDGVSPDNNKSAFYNRAAEKSLSHAEAKMIYQRHLWDSQDADPPLKRAWTSASLEHGKEPTSASPPWRSQTATSFKPFGTQNEQIESNIQSPTVYGNALRFDTDNVRDTDHSKSEADAQSTGLDIQSSLDDLSIGPYSDISPELHAIALNIRKVLDLRHKFVRLSLQSSDDNPKDWDDWTIYPPPPNPIWDENKKRPRIPVSKEKDRELDYVNPSISKIRKAGQNIGSDFDIKALMPLPGADQDTEFHLDDMSIFQVFHRDRQGRKGRLVAVPDLRTYYSALTEIQNVSSDGPTKSFAFRQLDILEGKSQLHFLINSYQETADCKTVPHRDFYNVRKVDTHVHHSACMTQKHLLRFIKSKMKKCPNEVVMYRNGEELTLQQVFDSINLSAYDLSIDTLDMHAHTDSFHRFDKFNLKYNPIGESRLREIFLKTDNYIQGRYLAELTKEVISDLEASKYQFVEWRISIYGRSLDEWDKLAAWVIDNKLVSHNVRWLIQIPRLYNNYKETGQVQSFEEILVNVFEPLFKVCKDPTRNPKLHVFLQRVVGFDSVDDESKIETRLYRRFPPPRGWNTTQNPPYTYWMYHLFANIASLNAWRQRRHFNTFVLRPHCGEAGDVDHLAAAVLCCHSISHGLMLRKVPLLQYIFYLDQIGIAMSPLSNNALFLSYDRNPFPKYLKRGLNVSLSTDDPLQFAFTKEPLIEEYSVAAQIYRLSAVDMCELASHSVMQSGYEHEIKKRWLGDNYHLPGTQGNSVAKSNVPDIRRKFRQETLWDELRMLERFANAGASQMLNDLQPSRERARPDSQTPGEMAPPTRSLELDTSDRPASFTNRSPGSATNPPGINHSPLTMRTPTASSFGPTNSQARIFPGIVHDRHRRSSVRQGSGSETDPESLTGSWMSEGKKGSRSMELDLREPVLEEAAE